MTTSDRVEKWKKLTTSALPSTAKSGALVPFSNADDVDDADVIAVDEDWMAQTRPDYVDPGEVMTEDDYKKIDEE